MATENREIIAAHRIPVETHSGKTSQYRRRIQGGRNKGFRLVDDVTKANMELIKRLAQLEAVQSAWYFNGAVNGKISDRRMKFDITDDIEKKVEKAAK